MTADALTAEGRAAIFAATAERMLAAADHPDLRRLPEPVQLSTITLAGVSVAVTTMLAHGGDSTRIHATIAAMIDAVLASIDPEEDDG